MSYKFVENKNGHCRLCNEPDKKEDMVCCDECDRWFHLSCAKLEAPPSKEEPWLCIKCSKLELDRQEMEEQLKKKSIAEQLNESMKMHQELLLARQNDNIPYIRRQGLIKLPRFNGAPKDWPKFISIFNDTTEEGAFTNLENLTRLEEALEGSAAKCVANLMISAANVPKIIQRLEEVFGRPEIIYNQLLGELTRNLHQARGNVITISEALDNLVTNMEALQKKEYLHDIRLIQEIIQKLPFTIQTKWIEVVQRNEQQGAQQATLLDLNKWLKPHVATMRLLRLSNSVEGIRSPYRENKSRVNMHNVQRKTSCNICTQEHLTYQCNKLKNIDVERRAKLISEHKLCFACLGKGHMVKECTRKRTCNIDGCKKTHNRILHQSDVKNEQKNEQPKPEASNLHGTRRSTVYYQIVPVKLSNGSKEVQTYAFLDPGSSLSLVDESVANQLGLEGRLDPLKLTWTQNVSKETPSKRVNLTIQGKGKPFTMKGVRTIPELQLPVQTLDMKDVQRRFKYLADLDIDGYQDAKPTILIGLEHSHLLITTERRQHDENSPMAVKTKLGWILFGKISHDNFFSLSIREDEQENLNELFKNYCSIEDFGVKAVEKLPKSKEDERAEEILTKTLKYVDGHYEVGLLTKYDDIKFPPSYTNALNRLETLEKMLEKKPDLKQWVINKFDEFLEKGYARKLSPSELVNEYSNTYYLPHFIITNKNKSPPKPRIVFDAATVVKGVSFNSVLLAGPDTLTAIFGVLLRFREHEIAISGDIMEMFQQIKIIPKDQNSQRYLWRKCVKDEHPDIYVMESMIFGSTCSPFCAQAVKNINASKFEKDFPQAANAIVKQHYVDDYLDSFQNIAEAKKIVTEIIDIHQHAGFHIRNFISNRKDLINSIPEERIQQTDTKLFENKDMITEKVLGIYWNTLKDTIQYQMKFDRLDSEVLEFKRPPTKREILSFVMSIYDPLGLISNITIQGKILLQKVHVETSNWDTTISETLLLSWKSWINSLKTASTLQIPRCMTLKHSNAYELHTFVDASEEAFAAVVYMRSLFDNGADVKLVAAKARVAPIKKMSIPRLELQGAVLGTRLMVSVRKELRVPITKIVMWTDSQTVLAWINSEHRKYKQFVAHRIAEILESTHMDEWRYIPSNQNPADEATKIIKKESKWILGPSFLYDKEENWPPRKEIQKTDTEIRNYVSKHSITEKYDFIQDERYSDFWKLKKNVNILKKYTDWISKKDKQFRVTSFNDMDYAEKILFKKAQWECFSEEIISIQNGDNIERNSKLLQLNPILDEEGVLRAKGRLEKTAYLPQKTRVPIILPYEHHISFLVVKSYHERYLHHNDNTVIAAIQQKFWILNCRTLLRKVKKYCQKCIIDRAKPEPPMMAALPDFRTQPFVYPFTNTGVDYFGPLEVTVKRSTEKRWGVIFTCMSSRAVHIELAEKLDTDSFFVCFRNFQNRRGKVQHLYSDNGTNFVGAAKELKILINDINERMNHGEAAKLEVTWTFNPPLAPHFGGVWERLIRSIKIALNEMMKAFGQRNPSPDTLRSALIQAEFFLNSRPLTHISVENLEDDVLTPFHILIGRAGEYIPPYDANATTLDKEKYKQAQEYGRYFWNRWKREYLPTLIKRNKWTNKVEPIKVDDLVVIVDDKAPPGRWLKGRIIKVNTAKDGQVRSVDITTIKGVYSRPTVKVAVLNVSGNVDKEVEKPK